MDLVGYALLAFAAAGLGAMGGLGGAIILVPALVLTGMPTFEAAPLGLISVAAGSIAAGAQQLRERSTNHRLGVVTEVAGSAGAVIGAMLAGVVSDGVLTRVLAVVAAFAAVATIRSRRGHTVTNATPTASTRTLDPAAAVATVGERIGSLSGVVPTRATTGNVSYTIRHLRAGLGLMTVAGLIAGTAGASGGFIKTPATSEIMGAPARVAAATTTFTVGITSSAALLVMAIDGRIDARLSSIVIAGSLVGGQLGAKVQSRLPDRVLRTVLAVLLAAVAIVLAVRA